MHSLKQNIGSNIQGRKILHFIPISIFITKTFDDTGIETMLRIDKSFCMTFCVQLSKRVWIIIDVTGKLWNQKKDFVDIIMESSERMVLRRFKCREMQKRRMIHQDSLKTSKGDRSECSLICLGRYFSKISNYWNFSLELWQCEMMTGQSKPSW